VARAIRQVDVFSTVPYRGNPVAVVADAEGLDDETMQRFANWMNLSETTFLLPPTTADADYRVRIFTPTLELPFAGHPTLGTCHVWLELTGQTDKDILVQECAAGLIRIRRTAEGLAFAAPPLVRSGPVEEPVLDRVAATIGVDRERFVAAEWVANGPGWVGVLLDSAEAVLALTPRAPGPGPDPDGDLDIGVVGPYPPGSPAALEVRAFVPGNGVLVEDPVTGSLNAALAQWLVGSGRVRAPYVASQGTVLGRAGRVHLSQDGDGAIWVGGGTVTCVIGTVEL
jgi:PhzF family phenazine biosynthesis protein